MIKILQINTVVNSCSHGRIAEEIGELARKNGYQTYIAYGRRDRTSGMNKIKIGTFFDIIMHGITSRLFDRHGLGSSSATKKLISEIEVISPDIIHLQNIHGYYLNYEILFKYLNKSNIPVVWTLHDCWSFTGHCPHFESVSCDKWKTSCFSCVQKKEYPATILIDNSKNNYEIKRSVFTSVRNITLVPVSDWLRKHLNSSFLSIHRKKRIYNGVDLDVFKPYEIIRSDKFRIIGVSSVWNHKKGLSNFYRLRKMLDDSYQITLIGLTSKQIKQLPEGITGIERTESVKDLARLYSNADVFVNPTYEDTFPTVNIESLACGTPVITYNTGGSPEAVTPETGFVVDTGDVQGLVDCINMVKAKGKDHYTAACRERAVKHFNKDDRYQEYIDLYKSILESK